MLGILVSLSMQEVMWGAMVGVSRHMESIINERRDAHGLTEGTSGLGIHIEGACGEIAFAKWRGRYYSGHVGSFKGADIGASVQIKTRSRHDYDLIVRDDDHDDHAFVLLTGTAPNFVLRGWLWGKEAKQDKYLKAYGNRPAAWFVPASDLRSMTPKRNEAAA